MPSQIIRLAESVQTYCGRNLVIGWRVICDCSKPPRLSDELIFNRNSLVIEVFSDYHKDKNARVTTSLYLLSIQRISPVHPA